MKALELYFVQFQKVAIIMRDFGLFIEGDNIQIGRGFIDAWKIEQGSVDVGDSERAKII